MTAILLQASSSGCCNFALNIDGQTLGIIAGVVGTVIAVISYVQSRRRQRPRDGNGDHIERRRVNHGHRPERRRRR